MLANSSAGSASAPHAGEAGGGGSAPGSLDRRLSMVEFSELIEAIDGAESFLVRLAAERISDKQLAGLAEIMALAEQAEARGDLASEAELDFEFHRAIGEASGNRFLSEIQNTLHRLTTRFVFLGFRRLGSSAGAMSDHRRILESLERRDLMRRRLGPASIMRTVARESSRLCRTDYLPVEAPAPAFSFLSPLSYGHALTSSEGRYNI